MIKMFVFKDFLYICRRFEEEEGNFLPNQI
jgi:hypothetical protein